MTTKLYTALDIGSKNLKFLSLAYDTENKSTKIIYKKAYPTQGVKQGYISNPELFDKALTEAIIRFKKETGSSIKEIILSLNSTGLISETIKINHQTVNQENISEVDLMEIERKILKHAEKHIEGEIILHKPIKFSLKDYDYYSDVEGLDAKKFSAEYIFVHLPKNHLNILEKIFEKRDIFIKTPIFSGNLASAEINAEKEDKNLGFLNIDLGSELTTISVWENNRIIFLENLKLGGKNITKKIAQEEKISFEDAEILKKENKNKKIKKIIQKELKILAQKIKKILEERDLYGLLPAGIIVYGGGSKFEELEEIFRNELEMPVKRYSKDISDADTDFYNPYGIIYKTILGEQKKNKFNFSKIKNKIKNIFAKVKI